MSSRAKALIVGLGNTLRGDDALGRLAADRLRTLIDPQQVNILDQCAPTPELCAEFAKVSLVVFLDASVDGPPGQVVTQRLTADGVADPTSHHTSLGELVALADTLFGYRPRTYLISRRGQSFELSNEGPSEAIREAVDQVVQAALQLIDPDAFVAATGRSDVASQQTPTQPSDTLTR